MLLCQIYWFFGQITKESAWRGRNMKKVIKRKTCRISILHNEKKISGQISDISTPKIWKMRFEVKWPKNKKIRVMSTLEPFPVPKSHFRSKFQLPTSKITSQEYFRPMKTKKKFLSKMNFDHPSLQINALCPACCF